MSTDTTDRILANTTTPRRLTQSKLYPWLVISLCASLMFYKYILSVSPSIMSHELMQQFRLNGAQMGNLAAMFFYTYTIVQIFSGVLLDRFSVRFLTGSSILISALGAWLFASTDTLWVAALARGMMGFGIAFATVTYLKMTAVWFRPEQTAFVAGLLATAVMLGAVFGQGPLAALLQHTSWRFVLFFCAILGLVVALLFMLFVRDKNTPSPKQTEGTFLQLKPDLQQGFSWGSVFEVMRSKQNWLLMVYSGLAFAPLSVLGGLWGNPFIQEAYAMPRATAAGFISLVFVGLGLGSPLFGLLSDRLRKRLPMMKLGALLSFFALSAVIYSPVLPLWLLGTLLFLFGIGVGAFMLGFTVGTQSNILPLAATVIALINTGDSIFESFTEPLLGRLLDLNWDGKVVDGVHYFSVHDYHYAFLPLPLYLLAAFLLLYFVKEPANT